MKPGTIIEYQDGEKTVKLKVVADTPMTGCKDCYFADRPCDIPTKDMGYDCCEDSHKNNFTHLEEVKQ